MHLKIVFIGLEEKIIFDKGILEEKDDGYKKLYYKLNNDTVEALFFNEEYSGVSEFLSNCNVAVIKEANKLKADEIESIKNNKDIIVVFESKNNKIINYDKEFVFPDLLKRDKISVYDIILTTYNIFEDETILHDKNGMRGIVGFSEIETVGQNILVTILNEFKVIEKCNKYSLNLFLEDKLGVDEIAYIEDPIREYTYNNSSFKINQNINEIYKDKIYFNIIGM